MDSLEELRTTMLENATSYLEGKLSRDMFAFVHDLNPVQKCIRQQNNREQLKRFLTKSR